MSVSNVELQKNILYHFREVTKMVNHVSNDRVEKIEIGKGFINNNTGFL